MATRSFVLGITNRKTSETLHPRHDLSFALVDCCTHGEISHSVSVSKGALLQRYLLCPISFSITVPSLELSCKDVRCYCSACTDYPGSSEVPRNPLTRWDVSSIPANGVFLTKKLKTKTKNAQRVEND